MVHLTTEDHLSTRRIATKMEISDQTIRSILRRYSETGSVKERPGRGRKRKISEEQEKKIVKKAKKKKKAPQLAREFTEETGVAVADKSIQRVLRKHNLHWLANKKTEALSAVNKRRRLDYVKKIKRYDWRRVLFSDEKTFFLGSVESHSWQEPGHRETQTYTRHPPKLHVWAAAGYYIKSQLYFFTENLTSGLYQRILTSRLPEKHFIYASDCPRSLSANWIFFAGQRPQTQVKLHYEFPRRASRRSHHPTSTTEPRPQHPRGPLVLLGS